MPRHHSRYSLTVMVKFWLNRQLRKSLIPRLPRPSGMQGLRSYTSIVHELLNRINPTLETVSAVGLNIFPSQRVLVTHATGQQLHEVQLGWH